MTVIVANLADFRIALPPLTKLITLIWSRGSARAYLVIKVAHASEWHALGIATSIFQDAGSNENDNRLPDFGKRSYGLIGRQKDLME
ncbi:MAG: hypothetical protein WBM65_20315 [Sedimenticolaceae bacterium]